MLSLCRAFLFFSLAMAFISFIPTSSISTFLACRLVSYSCLPLIPHSCLAALPCRIVAPLRFLSMVP